MTRDGTTVHVIENRFLRVQMSPSPGGQGSALIHKRTGKALTRAVSRSRAPGGSGLFIDRFWGAGQIRGFERLPYEVTVADKSPVEASVTLALTHRDLRVEKTISLRRGVSSLRVRYRITNEGASDYVGKFWVANGVFAGLSPKRVELFFPYGEYVSGDRMNAKGVRQCTRLTYVPGEEPPNSNNWINDPSRAWAAALADDGFGAALSPEYPFLERFYSWQSGPAGAEPFPTLEWLYAPMRLRPLAVGKADAAQRPEEDDPLRAYTFRTGWTLTPFQGLPTVDGVVDGIVASMVVGEDELRLALVADRPRRLDLTAARRKLSESTRDPELHRAQLTLEPDEVAAMSVPFAPHQPGTYVYTATLADPDSGQTVAAVEKPYVQAETDVAYVLAPEEHKNPMFAPKFEAEALGTDMETPCVPWAKPLAKPIRLLVVAPIRAHGEIAELLRRVDVDLTLVELPGPHYLDMRGDGYSSWRAPDPTKALEVAMGKDFDVLLLSGRVWWKSLPEAARNSIVAKVRAGAGLVYVCPTQLIGEMKALLGSPPTEPTPAYLTAGIPSRLVPGLKRFDPLSTVSELRHLGEGRVLSLRINPTPYGYIWRAARALSPAVDNDEGCDFPYWEYYYSLMARHILFAAKREPAIRIASAACSLDNGITTLEIHNAGKATEIAVTATTHDRRWVEVASQTRNASVPSGKSTVRLADLLKGLVLAGPHFVNLRVTRAGKAMDWATLAVERRAPARIRDLSLAKILHEPNEPVAGTIAVEAGRAATRSLALRWRVTDANDRLLMRQESSRLAGLGQLHFQHRLAVPPTTTLSWLNAELVHEGKVIDYVRAYFTVRLPRERDVAFTIWGLYESHHWAQRLVPKRMREIGFDWNTGMHMRSTRAPEVPGIARNSLAYGLNFLPMTMHDVRARSLKGTVRNPCLTNGEYLAGLKRDVLAYASSAKPYAPPAYFVADENSLGKYGSPHDFCQSETCLTRFREHLHTKYADLDELNRAWDAELTDWSAARPDTFAQAQAKGSFVSWAEHRLFMFRVFTSAFEAQKEALLEVDPRGRLAVSGMGVPLVPNGFDWYQLCRPLDYIIAYAGRAGVEDMMRSFKDPDDILGAWCGYARNGEQLRDKIWHEVLNQFFYPGYWHYAYLTTHGDNRLAPAGYEFKAIIDEVKHSGIGKMLVEARWVPSRIAMHQSTRSLVASNVSGVDCHLTQTLFNDNITGWCALIRDLGFCPPTFVSAEQIEQGLLEPERFPAFVLPLSQALSDVEVKQLRTYVARGGVLVADVRPGLFHENARPRSKRPLADVLGIAAESERPEALKTSIHFGETPDSGTKLPMAPVERSVSTTTGRAFGLAAGRPRTRTVDFGGLRVRSRSGTGERTVPAFVVNRHGQGWGVYLNCLFAEYTDLAKRGVDVSHLVSAMRRTLAAAGAKQQVTAELPVGSEMVRYRDRDLEYLGLCRRLGYAKDDGRAEIKLPAAAHVYDVRGRQYLGRVDAIRTPLSPGQAKVYALCPAKRGQPQIRAETTPAGTIRCRVSLRAADGQRATGIMRLTLAHNGHAVAHYARNLKVDGQSVVDIPLALSERTGSWTLRAMDAITGETNEARVLVPK